MFPVKGVKIKPEMFPVKSVKIKLEMFPVKGISLRFSTFSHRTLFYGNRNKLKKCENSNRSHKETVQDIYRCH